MTLAKDCWEPGNPLTRAITNYRRWRGYITKEQAETGNYDITWADNTTTTDIKNDRTTYRAETDYLTAKELAEILALERYGMDGEVCAINRQEKTSIEINLWKRD